MEKDHAPAVKRSEPTIQYNDYSTIESNSKSTVQPTVVGNQKQAAVVPPIIK